MPAHLPVVADGKRVLLVHSHEPALLGEVSDHAERAPRVRNTAPALVACLVVLGAAAIVFALHGSAPDHPASRPGQPAIQLHLPAGVRVASYGPVSVYVPAGLPTRTSLCGRAVTREVVAPDGAASLCPVATFRLARHPGTVIWFSTFQDDTPYARIPTAPTRVDGHPARVGYATDRPDLGTGVSAVAVLSEQHMRVGVTAPSRPAVTRLLSSIRIANVNPLGCAATVDAAASTPPGPAEDLVPADPAATVRCEYRVSLHNAGLLIGSYPLDPARTARLTDALDELHPDPCHCIHSGTPAPGHDEILYFHYTDGTSLRITGTLGANLDTYTNRTRTVANYDATIGQLLARLTNER